MCRLGSKILVVPPAAVTSLTTTLMVWVNLSPPRYREAALLMQTVTGEGQDAV